MANVIIIGPVSSVPSQLSRVCAGLNTLDSQRRFNLSWNPLPCHLQNGADITGYIIQYSLTSGGEERNISSSDHHLLCYQESGGPYRCLVPSSLFSTSQTYMFQVAAINSFGVGPFSGPVNAMLSSQGKCCITRIQFVLMLLR